VPVPSFQEDGLERTDQYVFRYMAPLGQLPPAQLIREVKSQDSGYSASQNKRNQSTSQSTTSITQNIGPSVNGLQKRIAAIPLHTHVDEPAVSNLRRDRSSRSSSSTQNERVHDLRGRKRRKIGRRQYVQHV
jgi:hypothetical protein